MMTPGCGWLTTGEARLSTKVCRLSITIQVNLELCALPFCPVLAQTLNLKYPISCIFVGYFANFAKARFISWLRPHWL